MSPARVLLLRGHREQAGGTQVPSQDCRQRQVRLGVWYVIILLWVQFWIRLAAVSYHSKKMCTVASPVVRSVRKSRDTHNCMRNEPQYTICVIFTTRLYYKALKLILLDLTWQITIVLMGFNVTRQVTARRQCWAWPATMVTTHESSLIMWLRFKGLSLFCILWIIGYERE